MPLMMHQMNQLGASVDRLDFLHDVGLADNYLCHRRRRVRCVWPPAGHGRRGTSHRSPDGGVLMPSAVSRSRRNREPTPLVAAHDAQHRVAIAPRL